MEQALEYLGGSGSLAKQALFRLDQKSKLEFAGEGADKKGC